MFDDGALHRSAPLVLESQWIAPGKSVTRDILDLAVAAGQCSMHFGRCEWVSPNVWKGQVPKSTHQRWVWAALSPAEQRLLAGYTKTQLREVLDAVGIGLWKLGRKL